MSQAWATWSWQAMGQFSPADPEAPPSHIRIATPTIRGMSAVSFFVKSALLTGWVGLGKGQSNLQGFHLFVTWEPSCNSQSNGIVHPFSTVPSPPWPLGCSTNTSIPCAHYPPLPVTSRWQLLPPPHPFTTFSYSLQHIPATTITPDTGSSRINPLSNIMEPHLATHGKDQLSVI